MENLPFKPFSAHPIQISKGWAWAETYIKHDFEDQFKSVKSYASINDKVDI